MSITSPIKTLVRMVLKPESSRSMILSNFLVALLSTAFCANLVGQVQQSASPTSKPETTIPKAVNDDARYRIGAGDVLTIVVRKAPELSGPVRVDQRGMIRLPMIKGEVMAACRTENELASAIGALYLEYKRDPSVEVFVTEFQSRPVAVIGAINSPGQFRLQRQVRLAELLSLAGGPSVAAGRVINIIHTGDPNICEKRRSASDSVAPFQGLVVLNLNDTMEGKEGSNPFVQPGDIISLPEADQVYVIGHVTQPRSITLKDKPITITRAIAMAGGAARDGKTDKVKVLREIADGEKQEIIVDLKAIQKRQAPDIALMPNDIVEVGASVSKTILNILTGAVPGAISNGVIRAIP